MQSSGVLLVVVESGAALPAWLGCCQGKVSDTIVLVSTPDEVSTRFCARAIQRVDSLSDSEQRVQTAVLVPSNIAVGGDALTTRLSVAQAILSHMARYGHGQLLLLTGHDLQPEAQLQLLNLAGTLSERLHGTKMTVALRFGAATRAEPPHELLEASSSQQRSSRRPSNRSGPMAKTLPPPEKELVSAVVQTAESSIESTG